MLWFLDVAGAESGIQLSLFSHGCPVTTTNRKKKLDHQCKKRQVFLFSQSFISYINFQVKENEQEQRIMVG